MTFRNAIVSALFGISSLVAQSPAFAGDTLKVGGTGAVTEALKSMARSFAAESGIQLEVVPSLGTSGANNAVADGKLGLAVAGRGLREKEIASGLRVAGTLRTVFGLATSRRGPDSLDRSDVVKIYQVAKPVWPDGMPLLIVLRPADESDNIVLATHFPGMADALQGLRKRHDLSIAATDQDNADAAEKLAGSLVGVTLTQVKTEKRDLRFVAIDGVTPSLETYRNGSYPFDKTFYLVVPTVISAQAEAFLAFLAKPSTEALLGQCGMIAGIK